ncbi:MAG: methionine--tRNA ligase [Ilumatobacter sp.]|uniref:methionine--tRNA ligase n=1 Tax=Ilumatobacter sp. TaxID=1967498 RepID=UPI002628E717|nr:methionine--tRNA ligase [Ilumatobacter sp.]MDJ0768838.1 methionine--tRNA ligase [Ilumatobacter sp.]
MSTPILVAVAWPYASGSRHLGHLAGAYLPADVFARYQRLAGNDVLMVSGSDVHGTPITVRAEEEGVTAQDIVDRYHGEIVRQWDELGISWDLYTTTGTENHARVTQEMFLEQLRRGHIDRRVSKQLYDPEAERFLPDRYVEGTCPHCGYGEARGDQCDNCGRTLDATDLIDPRSKLSGSTPELRETEHFYYRYSDFNERLAEWLDTREGWRPHVLNFAKSWTTEGLHDRAITRDIEWGIDLPVDDLGPGKRIYVWYDAVIGYLSASKEWAAGTGDPEAWRRWWEGDDARSYYFVGKDNIPFHCLFWPAQLMGAGDLNLPTDVPANQYVTFKGGKASASRGVGLTIEQALDRFEPDAIRFALAAAFPEHADTEVSEDEIARRINEELVATWGNLVNRVLSMVNKNCEGQVPDPGELLGADRAVLDEVDEALRSAAAQLEAVELKAGLRTALAAAQAVNGYLSETEPWKVLKVDEQRGRTILHTALSAVNGVRVLFAPYLPFSTARLAEVLGPIERWERSPIATGAPIPKPTPLFGKVDLDA